MINYSQIDWNVPKAKRKGPKDAQSIRQKIAKEVNIMKTDQTGGLPRDEEVIRQLKELQKNPRSTERFLQRIRIILSLMDGKSDLETAHAVMCERGTVTNVREKFQEGGIEAIKELRVPTPSLDKTYD